MAVHKHDTAFNELFISPIRGLYKDSVITVEEFKDRNAELLKNRWIDTSHGAKGEKIYELFDQETEGEIVKESLQEWLCDNRTEIMRCIGISIQNHEMSYAEWFKYVDDKSGPEELALYSLSRKYGIHTAVYNKSYVWTTLSEHIHRTDEEIFSLCGVTLVFLAPMVYRIIKNIRTPQPQPNLSPTSSSTRGRQTGKAGKVTCRSDSHGRKRTGTNSGRGKNKGNPSRTLSGSRVANYGLSTTPITPCSSKRNQATIDYLTLNDGLDEEAPTSPKKRRKPTYRPKSGPSASRVAAQKLMSSPEAKELSGTQTTSTLTGVPSTRGTTPNEPMHEQNIATLSGVPENTMTLSHPPSATLSGIHQADANSADIRGDELLPDLVLNRATNLALPTVSTNLSTNEVDTLEAASTLLSLHSEVRDDTLDEDKQDNALLMPIGGNSAP